jgi:hypothetical protein
MIYLDAQGALTTLLNLMALPATAMTAIGGYLWYSGSKEQIENRSRTGRFLVMFGLIMLAIVLILTYYLSAFSPAARAVQ